MEMKAQFVRGGDPKDAMELGDVLGRKIKNFNLKNSSVFNHMLESMADEQEDKKEYLKVRRLLFKYFPYIAAIQLALDEIGLPVEDYDESNVMSDSIYEAYQDGGNILEEFKNWSLATIELIEEISDERLDSEKYKVFIKNIKI